MSELQLMCRGAAGAVCEDCARWVPTVAAGAHHQLQIHTGRPAHLVCQLVQLLLLLASLASMLPGGGAAVCR